MYRQFASEQSAVAWNVLNGAETFWDHPDAPDSPLEMFRYSMFLGFFAFAGYLFSYSITGRIWNWWPFIQSTLPVSRALMCAGLQWVFFATFPLLSSLILDFLFTRDKPSPSLNSWVMVCSYSLTALAVAALFVGVPFIGRIGSVIGPAVFVYMLYSGYRIFCRHTIVRSLVLTAVNFVLFALIRQMFVFVIGF